MLITLFLHDLENFFLLKQYFLIIKKSNNDYIIGDTGLITPIGDDEAMAEAWQKMVEIKKETPDTYAQMGQAARQRTLDNFTLEQQVKQHEDLYRNLHNNNNASESDLIAES